MLQRLQKKFVLINMSLVSLVLIVTFTAICLYNYTDMKKEWHSTLMATAMLKKEPGPRQFPFDQNTSDETDQSSDQSSDQQDSQQMDQPPQDQNSQNQNSQNQQGPDQSPSQQQNDNHLYNAISFSVSIDSDGSVISKLGNNVEISEEVLDEIVEKALLSAETDKEGMLTEYQLRYLLMDTSGDHSDSDRTLAFVDVSEQLSDFHKLVLTLVIVGVLCELAFLIISIFLAKFTIKPVRIAWEQQRQFVADASHELKTPLTVILANVGILLGHKENTIAREEKWVDYIKTEAERMKKLVEDMLFLAKTDMAGLPVERRKINFSDLVMSSLLAFESVAFENGIKLKQEIAQEIALYGNETQLRQMAIIFLDNACKYTPSGGEVMVRLIKKQDKIYFSVKNTGSYIPKEVQDRIFERFYRVDESRVRKEGGYGLGLSIAKSIVDSHKGKLTVSSSEKDGTTFTMQFPQ